MLSANGITAAVAKVGAATEQTRMHRDCCLETVNFDAFRSRRQGSHDFRAACVDFVAQRECGAGTDGEEKRTKGYNKDVSLRPTHPRVALRHPVVP